MCRAKPDANCGEGRNAKPVLTPSRRLEIEQIANLYGSANCWTGTSGMLCSIIRELLNEIPASGVADRPAETNVAQKGPQVNTL